MLNVKSMETQLNTLQQYTGLRIVSLEITMKLFENISFSK